MPNNNEEETWLWQGTPPQKQGSTPPAKPAPSSDRMNRRVPRDPSSPLDTTKKATTPVRPDPNRLFGDDTPPPSPLASRVPPPEPTYRQKNPPEQVYPVARPSSSEGYTQKMAPHTLQNGLESPSPQPDNLFDNQPDLFNQDFDSDAKADWEDTPEAPPPQKPKKQKKYKEPKPKSKRFLFRLIRLALLLFLVVSVTGSVALGVFLKNSTRNDDLWLDLDQIPYRTATVLTYTDAETGEMQEYALLHSTQNKVYVDGSQIPQNLRNAFIAVEDKNFLNHGGFDMKRTVFAGLNEVKHAITGSYIGGENGRKQGASTINQQLIKNLTRDDEDSNMAGYLRKVREIYRAWKMDNAYDKDTILNSYLNTISFTENRAGVETEAQRLFGKSVSQLTLAECASLAAIPRNPSRYNPVKNPETHLERRDYVLYLMLEQEYITQVEYDDAIAQPLTVIQEEPARVERPVTSYFTDAVMDAAATELVNQRGISRPEATNLLYNGGLRIHTTVVPELQANMEKVMETASLYPRPSITTQGPLTDEDGNPLLDEAGNPVIGDIQVQPEAAMISLDYEGGICAVVGGLGEKEISRGFNRGTSAVRQVGSTMKPISPYICALEAGTITWSTPFLDAPVRKIEDEETGEMVDWPANVDRYYSEKDILVREGFARSVNTIAVRVGDTVGNRAMYRFVHNDLGISTFVQKDAKAGPLVLGSSTYGITPLEMARSYAIFGNGGFLPTVHSFTHITNGTGGTLLAIDYPSKQIIGDDNAFIVNRLMGEVLTGNGTASGMSVPGEMDSVGKTGTTSDHRDHWFIGLTPYYVTASWYGYDDNTPLLVNNSKHPPTLAWRNVMQNSQKDLPYKDFPTSATVSQQAYCKVSGAAAGPNCPSATGWYAEDNPPVAVCPVHGG